MDGGASLVPDSNMLEDIGGDPLAPFRRDRGFRPLPAPQLETVRARYLGWRARLDADRGVWPPPLTARYYVEAVLAELDAEIASRGSAVRS